MEIKENIELSKYTTMRTGGKARYFFAAETLKDIEKAVTFSEEKGIPLFVLGGGSNILVRDGFPGLVLKIDLKGTNINKEKGTVSACAGENWDTLVAHCVEEELYGLEALSAIPGTVGAAPVQNIGAYGKEVKNVIKHVEVFDVKEKQKKIFSNEECKFEYRNSLFKEKPGRYIVLRVTFILSPSPEGIPPYKDTEYFFKKKDIYNPTPQQIREAIIEIRNNKLPDLEKLGTSGSFFKNPIVSNHEAQLLKEKYPSMPAYKLSSGELKLSAAWLIEHIMKHKGVREGNVGIYNKHALVIVNYGKKNGEEVFLFAERIKKIIKEKTNIEFEYEVVVL